MEERTNAELLGFDRAMPFSREAEQSVIGAMLLDIECILSPSRTVFDSGAP